jgi:hypothetical protein
VRRPRECRKKRTQRSPVLALRERSAPSTHWCVFGGSRFITRRRTPHTTRKGR